MVRVIQPNVFWKYDLAILIVTVMYYLIAQFKINEEYSTGYEAIWLFFTFEHFVLIGT